MTCSKKYWYIPKLSTKYISNGTYGEYEAGTIIMNGYTKYITYHIYK